MVRVTLDTVMTVIKLTSSPIFSWPLPSDASRGTILWRNINRWSVIINDASIVCCIFLDIYRSITRDIGHALTISADVTAGLLLLSTIMLCRKEEIQIRDLLDELQSFMKQANQEELDVIQSYVDKCLYFHAVILISSITGPLVYILGPVLVTNQFLPLDFKYPFPIESTWLFAVIYTSQAITAIQVGSTVIFDFVFATLLWYTGARVQMLGTQLGRATTYKDVRRCIRQHQNLLEYVERLKVPTRLIVKAAISLAVMSIVASGLVLMRSQRIAVEAFNCEWVGKSHAMMKDLLFIMTKAQIPVVISVPGITDALTLKFYTSMMKAIFSYLTTLNAMLDS